MLILLTAGGLAAWAQIVSDGGGRFEQTVPDTARVSFTFDAPQYFLGENVLGHFCVENTGTAPFRVSMGGDYRGAARATRFHVTALDADGKTVADPYPGAMNFGGMEGEPTLKPGEKFYASLPVMRYLRFDGPGDYTIRVRHDLGWKATPEHPLPVAEAKITLVMPTAEQAQKIVDAIVRLPDDGDAVFGKKSRPYRDLTTLRYPVYLPILQERVRKGSLEALEAIGNIATPEATQTLIDLLPDANPKIAREAARLLLERLPWSQDRVSPSWPGSQEALNLHKKLVEQSWQPQFAAPERANALKMVQSGDRDTLRIGAATLQSVGDPKDLPDVLRALNRRIALTQRTPRWQSLDDGADEGWMLQDDCLELMSAAHALLMRGAKLPPVASTAAEAAVALRSSGNDEARDLKLLRHPVPFVRQLALENVSAPLPYPAAGATPHPLSPALLTILPALLADPDTSVREAACTLVAKTKDGRLKEPLLKALATGKSSWLLNSASGAALNIGAQYEMCLIWANRLDEPGMMRLAIENLAHVIKGAGGWGWKMQSDAATGRLLKPKWQQFLKENRARLQSGKLFTVGEAALSPDLFPKEFSVTVGNREWPPESRQ